MSIKLTGGTLTCHCCVRSTDVQIELQELERRSESRLHEGERARSPHRREEERGETATTAAARRVGHIHTQAAAHE